jgi:16S rRNA (guanine1207-N2)-methyltransferase
MIHYYDEKQESEDKRFLVEIKLKSDAFKLWSSSGIFSKNELDAATKLLIENAQIGENILDLGCGYGVVGIAILRKEEKEKKNIKLAFSDVNERAVDLTKENLKQLGLKGEVIKSDLFSGIPQSFDTILTNPPYAAGREICFKLIEDSFEHLNKNGTLQLVARHNKGGSTLAKKMEEVFGNVETIAKSGGFHVYLSRKT